MRPLADHGEETYVGNDRLLDRVALITGAGARRARHREIVGATGGKPLS